jgi:AcrR family transcriptional regulator
LTYLSQYAYGLRVTSTATTRRAVQRAETHERVFQASLAEYRKIGAAATDTRVVAKAADVALGTVYFHFPTKSHVLLELEQREDTRLAGELARFLKRDRGVGDVLGEVIRLVTGIERRLGPTLFHDLLAHHFSPARPAADDWRNHELVVLLLNQLSALQARGEIDASVDVQSAALVFLLALYGVLAGSPSRIRPALINELLTGTLCSLQTASKQSRVRA